MNLNGKQDFNRPAAKLLRLHSALALAMLFVVCFTAGRLLRSMLPSPPAILTAPVQTLSPRLVEGFAEAMLRPRYDDPVAVPPFHREMWADCCGEEEHVAIAAPREHAKSTAVTHDFGLAAALFGFRDYILIVSDTEGQSVKFLGDMRIELQENELLIREFGVDPHFIKDTETEIVFKCAAGLVNITAKGAEQKVRGLKWRGKRPNLVLVDDLENDELVMNKERRDKLRTWFLTALLPCGSKRCLFRVVGTVLHLDSVLNRLLEDSTWKSRRYEAHSTDFKQILWPEKFSIERLQKIRARFVAQGKPEKYSQEYLNQPIDEETAYYKKEWFLLHSDDDESDIAAGRLPLRTVAAVDIAVSLKETADYTVIAVAGVDASRRMHILDIRRGRWDSLETVEQMFQVQRLYSPDLFCVEKGPLHKAFLPFLNAEMIARDRYINLHEIPSTKDKMTRARSMQAKMKAGGLAFRQGDWLPDLLAEMTRFPRGKHDDQVDAMSLLGHALDDVVPALTAKEEEEEEYQTLATESTDYRGLCGYG